MKYDWGAQLMWLVGKEVGDLIDPITLAKLGEKMEIIPKHQDQKQKNGASWSYNFSTKTGIDILASGKFHSKCKKNLQIKNNVMRIDFEDSPESQEMFYISYYLFQAYRNRNGFISSSFVGSCNGYCCIRGDGYYCIDAILDQENGKLSIRYYDEESIQLCKSMNNNAGRDKDNKLGLYPFEQFGIMPDASADIPVLSGEQMLEELSNIALQRKSYLDSLLGINVEKTNSPQYVKSPMNGNSSTPIE